MISDEEMKELEKLLAAGTPGPWEGNHTGAVWTKGAAINPIKGTFVVCTTPRADFWPEQHPDEPTRHANGQLIAAAVNALPELIAAVRELQDLLGRFRTDSEAYQMGREAGAREQRWEDSMWLSRRLERVQETPLHVDNSILVGLNDEPLVTDRRDKE